jgi:thioredoxin 1
MTVVCEMSDELERIRARKIAEMANQSREGGSLSGTRTPVELNDSDFKSTIGTNHLVVIDCWAAWCYPCRLIAPVVEELAGEYGSAALFAKLNVDENPLTAAVYGVQSIPTILIIKDGVEVDRIVGAMPKEQIEAVIKRHL